MDKSKVYSVFSIPNKFKLGAYVISRYMGKKYSHSCILRYSEDFKSWLITEAAHGEVKPVELNEWLKRNKIVKMYEYVGDYSKLDFQWLAKQFDKNYAYLALPCIVLGFKFKDGDKTHICSEIVAKFFHISSKDCIRPDQVDKKQSSNPNFKEIPTEVG